MTDYIFLCTMTPSVKRCWETYLQTLGLSGHFQGGSATNYQFEVFRA